MAYAPPRHGVRSATELLRQVRSKSGSPRPGCDPGQGPRAQSLLRGAWLMDTKRSLPRSPLAAVSAAIAVALGPTRSRRRFRTFGQAVEAYTPSGARWPAVK